MTRQPFHINISAYAESGAGSYNFDNGSVAFSDITEHKRTAREYNKEYYRKVVKSSHVNRGYKLKHG